jgi:hypothetical protein
VTESRDELDRWLAAEVDPLSPLPGSFERIRGRARRRKLNQALTAGVAAVVLIAGAVLVPSFATGLLPGFGTQQPAASSAAPVTHTKTITVTPTPSPPASSSPAAPHTSAPPQLGTGLSTSTSGIAPAADFRPTSVTMISGSVGAVIGQANAPGQCATASCASLAGTSDYGHTWYGFTAPATSGPDGSVGVSQVRFLNLSDGWAFGPALYATTDGGRTWTSEPTDGLRVTDLEAAGSRAFAVLAACQGSGSDYAASCDKFSLYSSVAGSTTWAPVTLNLAGANSATAMGAAGVAASASLVIASNPANPQDGTGYLLTPSGDLLTGPLDGSAWHYAGKAPCVPGRAAVTGTPLGAELAVRPGHLLLSCMSTYMAHGESHVMTQAKNIWESSDGSHWRKTGEGPGTGQVRSMASTSTTLLLATTHGIDILTNGSPWQKATIAGGVPPGGFGYVGMTSDAQGVALPTRPGLGEVYITTTGGLTWYPFRISG